MPFIKNPPIETRGRKQGPVTTASKICQRLFQITQTQETSYRQMCRRAGFSQNGLTRWARGIATPTLLTAECWAETLGYHLEVLSKEEKEYIDNWRYYRNKLEK